MIICSQCGRDIDAIGQDNVSCDLNKPLCEDCAREEEEIEKYYQNEREWDEIYENAMYEQWKAENT